MAISAPGPDEARTTGDSPTAPVEPTGVAASAEPVEPVEPTAAAAYSSPAADQPRSPLLAALGAGEAAIAAVAHAFADAFSAAASTQKTVQQRVTELPAELDELRARFSGDELRRALEAYRVQVERAYAAFAGRGEEAWERLREQPQVRQAITTLESYTEKLDARVDGLVDEAQDAATRAITVAGRQTRVTGEKVARAGQRFSGRAADAVVDASAAASDAVEDAGTAAASVIEDAGEGTASVTRRTTRAGAKRTATRKRTPRGTGPDPE